jgi:sec-independent protein translocase protein TatC
MPTALRPVKHDDQLSLVEHLDELRTRLIVSLLAFMVCFGIALWQNDAVLDIVNRPFENATEGTKGEGTLARTAEFQRQIGLLAVAQAKLDTAIAADEDSSAAIKLAARQASEIASELAKNVPSSARQPVTLGVAEPFTSTFRVAAYAALLVSLPIILWQLYAFVLPAFSPRERKAALPLMMMVPFLFIAGVVFAYFVVVPSAIRVLQNFNEDNFDILVQAKDLYKFTILTCMGVGAMFQMPIGILLLTRMRILTVKQLRDNRRYAILAMAVVAMLLPGTDPVTMLLSMAPLVFLYEASILLAALIHRRELKRAAEEPEYDGPGWWDDDDEDDDEDA